MHRRVVKPPEKQRARLCFAGWGVLRRAARVVAGVAVCVAMHALPAVAQTAVDGAVAGKGVPGATVRFVLVEDDGTTRAERVLRVRADRSFLALRLPAGEYNVEERVRDGIVASGRVGVEAGELAEVTLQARSKAAAGGAARTSARAEIDANFASDALDVGDVARVQDESAEEARADDAAEQRTRGDEHPAGGALLSFRGLAPTQNRTLLDGVSGDQAFRGGARGGAAGGPRSAGAGAGAYGSGGLAVRVSASTFEAQYGGGAGAVIAATTPRAAGPLHGGASYEFASNALAARNLFAVVTHFRNGVVTSSVAKPQDLTQSFSARVGGTVPGRFLRARIAGFASVEQARRSFPAEASPATASFYALTPMQTTLLQVRGVTLAQQAAALAYLDSLTGPVARAADRGSEFVRLDGRASERDRVAASYARSRLSAPAGVGAGAATAVVARGAASVGDETVRGDAVTGRWLHLFGGGSVTNEVRAQYARDFEFETARRPLAQEPAISAGGYAPQVSIYDGSGAGPAFVYGTPASLGRRAYPDERRVEVADVAQLSAVRHLVTMGGDWSRVVERIDALNDVDGSFTYDSGTTGGHAGGLVDWITDYTFNVNVLPNGGCPSIQAAVHDFCFRSFAQSFGQSAVSFALNEFAAFAQDTWRVRAGLTVSAGVRYEYVLLPLPQRPNVALDAVFGESGATTAFPEDRNNFAPRVALAWAPHGARWGTVRVGYGAFAGRMPGTTVRAALVDTALPATATHVRITPGVEVECPQVAHQGFGFPCAYVGAPPALVAQTTAATVFARGFRLPLVQAAELSLARGWRGFEASASYSGAWATQLPKSTDLNIAPATTLGRFVLQGGDGRAGVRDGEAFVVPVYAARVSTQYGAVTEVESNANATWHALTVAGRARLRGAVELRGNYTWSKALDYGAEQGATPRRDGQFDPFDVRYDKGVADANVPQRFSGDVAWRTSVARGPHWLQTAATGWRAAALGSAASGRAYSYQVFGGTHLSGGGYSLNGSGGSAYLPTVGRNTLRMPTRWRVDARVARGFGLGHIASERLRGEGFAEAMNVINHVSASRVNDRAFLVGAAVNGVTPMVFQDAATVVAEGLSSPAFGAVTSSTLGGEGERRVRVGVRVEF